MRDAVAQNTAPKGWLISPQPRLGTVGLIALMVLVILTTSLASDVYTPSIPEMPVALHTTPAMVNLTLSGFIFFDAVGMLIFGAVSDKLGRKPIMLMGTALFGIGSALCIFVTSVGPMVVFRLIAALGAGAESAVCTALVKDCFVEEKRNRVLTLVQMLFGVGPVAGPLLGGVLVKFFTWRSVFVVLALFGLVAFVCSLLFTESLPPELRSKVPLVMSLKGLGTVARNKGFTLFLIVATLINLPFMAYIASVPYIYTGVFGLSQQAYSYCFAVTALATALGSGVGTLVAGKLGPRNTTHLMLGVSFALGSLFLFVASRNVICFFVVATSFSVVAGMIRPYVVGVMLDQQEGDTGSASSLINFSQMGIGAVGMELEMLPWRSYITGIGVLALASMGLAIIVWVALLHSRITVIGVHEPKV